MPDEKSLIKKSALLLYSSFIFVAAIYVLDLFYAKGFHVGFGILPSLMVIVPLKIFVFSGMYGTLAELISGERMVFTFRDFQDNAKRYWKGYTLLMSVPLSGYVILTLFIFKFIPVTLTLAGIAGLILSVGMAVDANILIFERMKEELRSGKPRDIAVENGFKRAWTSIRDSNISSLITSFILYYFGSGIVRGFAFTLAIGILISMFSAITITRNLLRIFDRK